MKQLKTDIMARWQSYGDDIVAEHTTHSKPPLSRFASADRPHPPDMPATVSRYRTWNLKQSLYKSNDSSIFITSPNEGLPSQEILAEFAKHSTIGLAGEYKSGHLSRLILSTPLRALRISAAPHQASGQRLRRDILSRHILLKQDVTLVAFNLDRLALALHCDMGLRINNGVDLLSLSPQTVVRSSMSAVFEVLGGSAEIHGLSRVVEVFQNEQENPHRTDPAILRAWSACYVANLPQYRSSISSILRIDTARLEKKHLDMLARLIRISFKLEDLKPSSIKNDISENIISNNGEIQVVATRYKTRPRVSASQSHRIELKDNASQKGRITAVNGRDVTISTDKPLLPGNLLGITTIGKDRPTSAEAMKADIIFKTLQRAIELFENPFVSSLWFAVHRGIHTPSGKLQGITVALNPSQLQSVHAMLRPCLPNGDAQLTMVHGPPGSGKTSVVAAFVQAIQSFSYSEYGEAVYLVAHSNVAVKNIAEKLAKISFNSWKLIVSRDFHFDWHEHLYQRIKSNIIESIDLPGTLLETEREFGGIRVILCTLSMLSNERLGCLTRRFPPKTIIVDEASQIELGDYLPVFHMFRKTLRRLCFVGDDKQLAPYGQEDIGEIQSVFEIQEFRRRAIFLDIQYRMPIPIGAFISQNVYGGKLKSCHLNNDKKSCRWVDVDNGVEEAEGHSWKNSREVRVVTHLVRQAHSKGENFRVITPYDAQRNCLEQALKEGKLPWEDRCFNVDSFQGNEEDHIIVSIVRSKKPGFLTNERRTNVLLTRCKKKMTICTNRTFLERHARNTLVGRMATSWGPNYWISGNDVINERDS